MKGLYHPSAVVLNATQESLDATAQSIAIAADANEFWVLRKIWVSNDASGVTDFNNLASFVTVSVTIGSTTIWTTHLHPGNGGTASLEFENGPWEFDLGPGLYVGTKNEAVAVAVGSMGTGIKSRANVLYQ